VKREYCDYFGLIATATGELTPPPEKGEPVTVPPVLVKALTFELPEFVTHTLLEASIAILLGLLRPLFWYTVPLLPFEFRTVMVLLPLLATQALPLVSIAIAEGLLKPPAVKPLLPEIAVPLWLNFDTLLLPELVTHTLPAESVAIADGVLRPPPV